jgi:transposase InsO family protein
MMVRKGPLLQRPASVSYFRKIRDIRDVRTQNMRDTGIDVASYLRMCREVVLMLQREGERREERRHNGRVAVDLRNTRWCSDGLEITCDNGEKVRVAFALDCCDREAMGHVATAGGITAEDVQDLMVATVEHRYGQVNRVRGRVCASWRSSVGGSAIGDCISCCAGTVS